MILLPESKDESRPDLVIVIQDDQRCGATLHELVAHVRRLNPDRVYTDTGGTGRISHAYFVDALGPNVARELPKGTGFPSVEQLRTWDRAVLCELLDRVTEALMPPKPLNDDGLKWLRPSGPKQARMAEVNRVIDETIKAGQGALYTGYVGPGIVDMLSYPRAACGCVLPAYSDSPAAKVGCKHVDQADKAGRVLAEKLLKGHGMTSDDLGDRNPGGQAADAPPLVPYPPGGPEPTFMEKCQREREELQQQQLKTRLTAEERHSFEAMKREVEWMRARRPYRPGFVESSDDYDYDPGVKERNNR